MSFIAPDGPYLNLDVAHDLIGELDRQWFAKHRRRPYRLRPIHPVERIVLRAATATHVLVEPLGAGLRFRHPIIIKSTLPALDEPLTALLAQEAA